MAPFLVLGFVSLITSALPLTCLVHCYLTSHKSFSGFNSSRGLVRHKKRMESNCVPCERKAEGATIITCQMEEIVPLKQGRLLQMTYAYLHPHTPSIHPCLSLSLPLSLHLSLQSTSWRHTFSPLHSHVSSSLHNPSPADLFRNTKWNPLALLTCIKCLHSNWGLWKRLPLRRSRGTQFVKHADCTLNLDLLPNTCDMNWPVRWWSKQNEEVTD